MNTRTLVLLPFHNHLHRLAWDTVLPKNDNVFSPRPANFNSPFCLGLGTSSWSVFARQPKIWLQIWTFFLAFWSRSCPFFPFLCTRAPWLEIKQSTDFRAWVSTRTQRTSIIINWEDATAPDGSRPTESVPWAPIAPLVEGLDELLEFSPLALHWVFCSLSTASSRLLYTAETCLHRSLAPAIVPAWSSRSQTGHVGMLRVSSYS